MRTSNSIAARLAFVAGTALALSASLGQSPQLLGDIDPTPPNPAGSSAPNVPQIFGLGNGKAVFFALTDANGFEPWVTDGTVGGTSILRDINPGSIGSQWTINFGATVGSPNVSGFVVNPITNKALFIGVVTGRGANIFITDGTTAGTIEVPINPTGAAAVGGGFAVSISDTNVGDLAITGGPAGTGWIIEANGTGQTTPSQIWQISSAGVPSLLPAGGLGNTAAVDLLDVKQFQIADGSNRVTFAANDGVNNRQLFIYDPSAPVSYTAPTAGTPTANLNVGNPRRITNLNVGLSVSVPGVLFWIDPAVLIGDFDGAGPDPVRTRVYFAAASPGTPVGATSGNDVAGAFTDLWSYEVETGTAARATNVPFATATPAAPSGRVQFSPVVAGPKGNERIFWIANSTAGLTAPQGGGTTTSTVIAGGTRLYAHNPYAAAPNFQQMVATAANNFPFPRRGVAVPFNTAGDSKLVFVGGSATNGWEISTSDGTAAGTSRVADLTGGTSASGVSAFISPVFTAPTTPPPATTALDLYPSRIFVKGSNFFFSGTNIGTALATPAGNTPGQPGAGNSAATTSNQLFGGSVSSTGVVSVGAAPIVVINPVGGPATAGQNANPTGFSNLDASNFVFWAGDTTSGFEPRFSNGTGAGTGLIADIYILPGGSAFDDSISQIFYDAGTLGGTPKTAFAAFAPTTGYEPFLSEGTAATTARIRDVNTSVVGTTTNTFNSNPFYFKNVAGSLLFGATNNTPGTGTSPSTGGLGYEIYKSDGTSAGTTILADTFVGAADGFAVVNNLNQVFGDQFAGTTVTLPEYAELNGKFLFPGTDGTTGTQLYAADPVTNTTTLVKQISSLGSNALGGPSQAAQSFVKVGNQVFFIAADGVSARTGTNLNTANEGGELWVTDGTSAGTNLTFDYGGIGNPPTTVPADGSRIREITPFAATALYPSGGLFFFADDGFTGLEPCIYDIATNTITNLADINTSGPQASSWVNVGKNPPAIINNVVYFSANDGINGTGGAELYSYNLALGGSPTRIQVVPAANNPLQSATVTGGSIPQDFQALGTKLIFAAREIGFGFEPFVYDTTLPVSAGVNPSRIADLFPGGQGGFVGASAVFNGQVYFPGFSPAFGVELVKTDGVAVTLAGDIEPGVTSSFPEALRVVNGSLYFVASTFLRGTEAYSLSGAVVCNPADIADNGSNPGSDGCVDNGDFSLFISQFFNAGVQASCTGSSIPCAAADIADNGSNPGADGFLDNGDFSLFISSFFGANCTATCGL
jgi:ELWxxDGT repeat protein